ncbi:hypothetical protein, partial [Novipirellula herctigrandis]|uniref:hypothetical protein n=1 Tax=Novipirellula herctigrandis TaxID=2527986 RepID=UPI003AF377D0
MINATNETNAKAIMKNARTIAASLLFMREYRYHDRRTAVISGDGRTTCKQTRKRTTRPPLHH